MRLIFFLLLSIPALAQWKHLSLGVTGGVPFNRMTSSVPFGPDESKRYTVGITIEAKLNEHVSVNFNPLYKRTGVRFGLLPNTNLVLLEGDQLVASSSQVRSHSLELPVIGKYTFRSGDRKVRPFLGAGFSFQTAWQRYDTNILIRNAARATQSTILMSDRFRTPFDVGAVASAGVNIRQGWVTVAPEIRFTRYADAYSLTHRRSQTEFLLSLRF